MWSAIGIVVFALVGLLFIVDALREQTAAARVGALLAISAGLAQGAELVQPWLPLGLILCALLLYVLGDRSDRKATPST
jgi:hypothetical protein